MDSGSLNHIVALVAGELGLSYPFSAKLFQRPQPMISSAGTTKICVHGDEMAKFELVLLDHLILHS